MKPTTRTIHPLVGASLLIGLLLGGIAGCGRDARLADHELRDPSAQTVTYYGQRLDKSADPKQVVYVLLKAIVDDYAAGDDLAKREAALDIEFDVAAPEYIKQRAAGRANEQRQKEALYDVVRHWAPVLGYYRASFGADFAALAERMYVAPVLQAADRERVDVYLNVDHPHPEEAGPNAGAVARFRLVREDGYWRIYWVGWDNTTRDWRTRFGTPQLEPPATD